MVRLSAGRAAGGTQRVGRLLHAIVLEGERAGRIASFLTSRFSRSAELSTPGALRRALATVASVPISKRLPMPRRTQPCAARARIETAQLLRDEVGHVLGDRERADLRQVVSGRVCACAKFSSHPPLHVLQELAHEEGLPPVFSRSVSAAARPRRRRPEGSLTNCVMSAQPSGVQRIVFTGTRAARVP
jgi:hypothetical protein